MPNQVVKFYPQGKQKEFIVRKPDERVLKIDEVRDVVFSELKVMNLLLTNACNLACSYCFEQHKKDYGRFDVESLKKAYDFFAGCNDLENKRFQFFGGEPMAQKKLHIILLNIW
jgi:sulfatase maturation enzyme AslB (radical SAM superfamily)